MKRISLLIICVIAALVAIAPGPPDEVETDGNMPRGKHTFTSEPGVISKFFQPLGSMFGKSSSNEPHACTIYASDPWKTGTSINGDGWVNCTGNFGAVQLSVTVQRYLWGIWWRNLAIETSAYDEEGWKTESVEANCTNGTHTYRIVSHADVINPPYGPELRYRVQSENYLRVACP